MRERPAWTQQFLGDCCPVLMKMVSWSPARPVALCTPTATPTHPSQGLPRTHPSHTAASPLPSRAIFMVPVSHKGSWARRPHNAQVWLSLNFLFIYLLLKIGCCCCLLCVKGRGAHVRWHPRESLATTLQELLVFSHLFCLLFEAGSLVSAAGLHM